jgi:hypothetical protein
MIYCLDFIPKLKDLKSGAELENIRGTDLMKNGVLHRVKNERYILHRIKRWKADWTAHMLRRKCLLNKLLRGRYKKKLKGSENKE